MNVTVVSTVTPGVTAIVNSPALRHRATCKWRALWAWASRPFKLDLRTFVAGIESATIGVYGSPCTVQFPTGFIEITTDGDPASDNRFRVHATNLDTGTQSTDIHITFFVDQV